MNVYLFGNKLLCERCGNLECADLDHIGIADNGDVWTYPQGPVPLEEVRTQKRKHMCSECRASFVTVSLRTHSERTENPTQSET